MLRAVQNLLCACIVSFFSFTDILAGFTFNNRVLRLPAIVLLFNKTIAGRRRTLLLSFFISLFFIYLSPFVSYVFHLLRYFFSSERERERERKRERERERERERSVEI